MEPYLAFLLPIVAGLFIGVLSGMLGIGGGTIMVPLFRLGFGMSALAATATSLFAILPTSIAGALSHIRNKTCDIPLGVAMGIGGACMSPVGVLLAEMSPSWAVMAAAALVIAYSAITMLVKAIRVDKTEKPREAMTREGHAVKKDFRFLAIGFGIGLLAGVLAGYVGLGGGFIMVPLMITVLHMSMKKVSGTSLVAMVFLLIPGVIVQGSLGNVDFLMGILMAIGSIPGAVLGATLVRHVPERALRLFFGIFLLIAASVLAANEFLGFG